MRLSEEYVIVTLQTFQALTCVLPVRYNMCHCVLISNECVCLVFSIRSKSLTLRGCSACVTKSRYCLITESESRESGSGKVLHSEAFASFHTISSVEPPPTVAADFLISSQISALIVRICVYSNARKHATTDKCMHAKENYYL